MAKQLTSSPGTKKISEIYRRIKEGSLILQPEFQRKYVWTSEHKEEFIDTILKGLPFPEIYIAQKGVDIETKFSQEVIVDGQQRLGTIIQYIDEPEESKDFGKTVRKYKYLSKDEQNDLLNYNVVFRDLGDIESSTIKEIFRRINLTKFGLEQIEIQQAIYDGEFIMAAKEILKNIEPKHLAIFSDSELTRMADLHFILLLMSTVISGGYFARDTEIEKSIVQYNEKFDERESIVQNFTKHFQDLSTLELPTDSIWFRKSNYFTLFLETYQKLPVIESLKNKLLEFEKNVIENKMKAKEQNEFSLYYSNMYTGTNNRTSRVTRGELFQKYILV